MISRRACAALPALVLLAGCLGPVDLPADPPPGFFSNVVSTATVLGHVTWTEPPCSISGGPFADYAPVRRVEIADIEWSVGLEQLGDISMAIAQMQRADEVPPPGTLAFVALAPFDASHSFQGDPPPPCVVQCGEVVVTVGTLVGSVAVLTADEVAAEGFALEEAQDEINKVRADLDEANPGWDERNLSDCGTLNAPAPAD